MSPRRPDAAPVDVRVYRYGESGHEDIDGRQSVIVQAGARTTRRVVPPAGESYAFDVDVWDYVIEIAVSRTGASVRLFANGTELHLPPRNPHDE